MKHVHTENLVYSVLLLVIAITMINYGSEKLAFDLSLDGDLRCVVMFNSYLLLSLFHLFSYLHQKSEANKLKILEKLPRWKTVGRPLFSYYKL